ncbi:hypothetical protein SADUNF_Sadunf10G0065500 [Salix dunnii]|uniref:Uncharacterized protein n=1 Tax=Salix dunnii TaxID=1413687 RepID=A0A835MY46_9ROSI|nr:hypothetical protein SADUNF_Sadunf10G0065500 [Salix dunnii]
MKTQRVFEQNFHPRDAFVLSTVRRCMLGAEILQTGMMNDVQQPREVGISSAILAEAADLQSKKATSVVFAFFLLWLFLIKTQRSEEAPLLDLLARTIIPILKSMRVYFLRVAPEK